ncbi:MAG: hypothetical protein Q9219_002622 [cf. Caloplaca sp. 3 TL-2023]
MSGSRSSSGSTKSSAYKRPNANQQLSQIEKSVTHLLVATKQLLETLTQWSRHTATEGEVSDVYVRLGYEFNIACRAFNSIGVETGDLGPVPELLRTILEETLSQEASPASLDRFLPRIRDIIISLLHGLKRKQSRLRAKQGKESASSSSAIQNAPSSSGLNSSLNHMPEDGQSRRHPRGSERRTGSGGSTLMGDALAGDPEPIFADNSGPPPRHNSAYSARQNSGGNMSDDFNRPRNRESQRIAPSSGSDSSMPTSHAPDVVLEQPQSEAISPSMQRITTQREGTSYPPPPPPPKQQDALAALQRGGDLERRASRRYSAYQISKHLGASPNGVPMLPPAQNSPVPNRGRDVRESMNAVRVRGSGMLSRQRSTRNGEPSPVRNNAFAQRISEGSNESTEAPEMQRPEEQVPDDSPLAKTPEDKLRQPDARLDDGYPKLAATLTGPAVTDVPEPTMYDPNYSPDKEPSKSSRAPAERYGPPFAGNERQHDAASSPVQSGQFIPEDSPQPGKELTLFLQYKSRIKKFVLPDGATDLSIARLQLAFIEKFAWNTHSNGNDLPEIYIQDPVSGVRHELEDLRDVKERSVLVLNVEALDEVKRHIDEGLGGLRRMVEGVRTVVDSQQATIQRVSDTQQATNKEFTRIASGPSASTARVSSSDKAKINGVRLRSTKFSDKASSQETSIQTMKRDLAAMRQSFTSLVSDMNSSMAEVNTKASQVKTMAIEGVLPSKDSSTGRAYVNSGKKTLGEDSEKLVDRVDNLQDVVEDLRKDVVTRGVRPLPRQLETVGKNIGAVTAELKKMQEYLKREKPVWTKIWEKELQLVCSDRDLLTMQEELAADLEDDLEKAAQTFALVEQATKQQNLQSSPAGGTSLRSTSKGLTAIATDQEIDPVKAKDGVLGEVRALQPNHETRLEAIERAERARQEELESRREGAFKKELGSFVEEGKLKKSGGVQEAERVRKEKDEKNRLEAWGVQQERAPSQSREEEHDAPAEGETEESEQKVEGEAKGANATEVGTGTAAEAQTQQIARRAASGRYNDDHVPYPATRAEHQRLEVQEPVAVRKMMDNEGQMFFQHYWQFDREADEWEPHTEIGNATIPSNHTTSPWTDSSIFPPFQAPLALHRNTETSPPYAHWARALLHPLDDRAFTCPSGTGACTSINRPNSCCPTGSDCHLLQDNGLEDVACCASGQTCSGTIQGCAAGYTNCPGDAGGGCCIPGYACVGSVGCAHSSTTTVIVTPQVTASPPPSGASTTTTTSPLEPLPLPPAIVFTLQTTVTTSSTSTSTATFSSSPPSQQQTTTASPSSGFVPPARPTSAAVVTTSFLASSAPSCPTGFYQCSAYYHGGCCRVGRDCGLTDCPATASTTVAQGNGVTVVAPTGVGDHVQGGGCAAGWQTCGAEVGGGCCPPGGFECGRESCVKGSGAKVTAGNEAGAVSVGKSVGTATASDGGRGMRVGMLGGGLWAVGVVAGLLVDGWGGFMI